MNNNNNNRKSYNNNFFNEFENDKKELYKKNSNDIGPNYEQNKMARHIGNNNVQKMGHKKNNQNNGNNNITGNWNNYNNNRIYDSSNIQNKGNKNISIKRNLISGKPNKSMEHIKNNIIKNKILKNYNFSNNSSSNTIHKNEFRTNSENNSNQAIQQFSKGSQFNNNKKITHENQNIYNFHNITNSNLKNIGNDNLSANNNIYHNPDFLKKKEISKKALINNNLNMSLIEKNDKNKKFYDYSQTSSYKGYNNITKEKKILQDNISNTNFYRTEKKNIGKIQGSESDTTFSQYSNNSFYNKNNEQLYGNNVIKKLYNNKISSNYVKFDNSQNEKYNLPTETESRGLYFNKKNNDVYKNVSENINNYIIQPNNNFNNTQNDYSELANITDEKGSYPFEQASEHVNNVSNVKNMDNAKNLDNANSVKNLDNAKSVDKIGQVGQNDESLEKKIYQTISNNKEAINILSKYFKNINGNIDPATLNNIILECKNNKVLANILNGIKKEISNSSNGNSSNGNSSNGNSSNGNSSNGLGKLTDAARDKGAIYNYENNIKKCIDVKQVDDKNKNNQVIKHIFKSTDFDNIKNKWNMCIIKYKDKNVYNIFNNVENSINMNIKNVDIFKSSLFCSNNYNLSKDIFYNNYKIVLTHNVKYLLLENIFSFKTGSEKKNSSQNGSNVLVENSDNNNKNNVSESNSLFSTISYADSSFDNFCLFFNNFYQINEWYRNKLFCFLVYKIIIMDEEENEYHSYYSIFLKILDKNTFVFFLSVLINLIKNYSLKLKYMINVIERLLPVLAKKKNEKKKNEKKKYNSISNNYYSGSSTKKYILFNILYFKLLRLLFYKIENFYVQKKHLLLLFLRYIKNFLLNICNSTIIIQYLFIKCIELMNKYNNQQYILIKTISMEILLQLWNNEFLKLSILKMGKSIIRFIIFISNVEYVNKNIFPFILSYIETANQIDVHNYISSFIQNNKYYKQKKKRLKHFLYYLKKYNVLSLYYDNAQTNKITISLDEDIEDGNVDTSINYDQNSIYGNTIFDLLLQIKGSFNYFNILLSKNEKNCLDFLLNLDNSNTHFHFHLFYDVFIQTNLTNLVNENKLVYYFEWLLNEKNEKNEKNENGENGEESDSEWEAQTKGIISLSGNLKEERNSVAFRNKRHNSFIENENSHFPKKAKYADTVNDDYGSSINNNKNGEKSEANEDGKKNEANESGKKNEANETNESGKKNEANESGKKNESNEDGKKNESNENLPNYCEHTEDKNYNEQENEKVMYCLYELLKKNDGIISKIYCSHIKLSFFFNIFFYKGNEMSRILSSSLSIYSRKYKNFKRDNQKVIKFMNINNITHFLIIKFMLKYLGKIKCNDDKDDITKDMENEKIISNSDKDIFTCYKILDYSLKKDINNVNSFLNYINKIILHLYEKKRENIVLSLIISFSIYNFISYIERGDDNKKTILENIEKFKLIDIVNDIYKNCLIGFLLKGNNYFIDEGATVINLEDIYNYELTNHMKIIPKNINKEIFDLVNFKKYIFQKGNYKKIETIKICKKNMINNLYTSEILNYIYYNVLYIVIHLIMNIKFYYTIFFNTYKKNIHHFSKKTCFIFKTHGEYNIKTAYLDSQNLANNKNLDHFFLQTSQQDVNAGNVGNAGNVNVGSVDNANGDNDDNKCILLKLERGNYNCYIKKKKLIIKYYRNVKKNIIKNLKQYILVNNSHIDIKTFMQDSIYFDILFTFYKSPIFMQTLSFSLYSKNTNMSINDNSAEINFNLKILTQVKDIFSFIQQVNKIVYLIVHKGLYSHKEIICILKNCIYDNTDDINCNNFCIDFFFYEIVDTSYYLNRYTKCNTINYKSDCSNNNKTIQRTLPQQHIYTNDRNEDEENWNNTEIKIDNSNMHTPTKFGNGRNWLFRYSYKNEGKNEEKNEEGKNVNFNELLDYVVYSINNSYKKERIIFWSEFFYSLKNFGIINFQIFFYLCSMLKMVKNINSEFKNRQIAIIKKKIKIVEKIYILYLFKIGFIFNMSIYETFDFLFSTITIIFNYNFFNFYMNKKVYNIDKDKEGLAKSFASYIEKDIENIINNYDQMSFIEAIKYINDSIFLLKTIKNLILKSYSYINIIMHISSLKNIIIDMNNITYLQINNDQNNKINKFLEKYKSHKFNKKIKQTKIDTLNEKSCQDGYKTYDESICSEKFSSSSNDEIEKLDASLEYFSSHLINNGNINNSNINNSNTNNGNINNGNINNGNINNGNINNGNINNNNNINTKKMNSFENEQINNIKTMWIFKIFKNFYSKSFICFQKNKTDEENFYENKKKLIYFFFPKCVKKNKKTMNNWNFILDKKIYELRKKLTKDNNFVYMSKQAFLLKWIFLRLFILRKYKYKKMNNTQTFNYIYKKLNLICEEEEELIRFNITSDSNLISLGNQNLRYIFHIFLCHINNNLIYLINKCIKIFKTEGGTYIDRNITNKQNEINKKKQKIKTKGIENTAIDCINFYSTNFLLAFYPYLIKSRISYDIFFNLFKIYFSLYLINKHTNRLSIESPIYIILLIFSHQITISKYVIFSYINTFVNFIHSSSLSDMFCLDSLTHQIFMDNIRDSINYFMKNAIQENAVFDDIIISYDANSISLFYHMLFGNF
ncbi:hypothetical protein YYC_00795 [Plasmodium yoelii 17X]|uniref:Uncharacterized protein n=1 Tax=Plasmodium yoelii 17X TaxID=1323249 RepID=V7PSR8_PLAYE|nr:hypothetical protein YYC_00795 [Plasmodium yoelii 17X]